MLHEIEAESSHGWRTKLRDVETAQCSALMQLAILSTALAMGMGMGKWTGERDGGLCHRSEAAEEGQI
jgi:hypothetical protein